MLLDVNGFDYQRVHFGYYKANFTLYSRDTETPPDLGSRSGRADLKALEIMPWRLLLLRGHAIDFGLVENDLFERVVRNLVDGKLTAVHQQHRGLGHVQVFGQLHR